MSEPRSAPPAIVTASEELWPGVGPVLNEIVKQTPAPIGEPTHRPAR